MRTCLSFCSFKQGLQKWLVQWSIVINQVVRIMGGTKSKPVRINKLQIEIAAMRVREYLNLQKERKSNEAIKQEKQLLNLINGEVRNRQEEYMAMERIISILKYLNACRILISYAEILKANSQLIVESLGSVSRIDHLLPYIEGMIYANKPMGLNSLSEFKNMLLAIFGREMIDPKDRSIPMDRVEKDLIACFEGVKPSFNDVNTYAIEMAKRHDLSIQRLNKVGHNFSEFPVGTQQAAYLAAQGFMRKASGNGQGFQQPPPNVPPGGFGAGYPGGQGGYGPGQGGFGPGQGGQGGYPGGGYPGGGYPGGQGYGQGQGGFGGQQGGQGGFGGQGGYGQGGYPGGGMGGMGGNQGPPQPYNSNNTFNPDNYMPIYQPNNFGVDPNNFQNPNQNFQGMHVPKTAIKFAPDYPEQSALQKGDPDLDSFEERLKKL